MELLSEHGISYAMGKKWLHSFELITNQKHWVMFILLSCSKTNPQMKGLKCIWGSLLFLATGSQLQG